MSVYIGIDQSFTSTGVVVVDHYRKLIGFKIITSDPKDDNILRAWCITNSLRNFILDHPSPKIAIEGLAFSANGRTTRDLAGLQYAVAHMVRYGVYRELTIVPPTTLKKSATGSGRATKKDMVDALPQDVLAKFSQKYSMNKGLTDLADAYHLAVYACNETPKTHPVKPHINIAF